VRNDAAGFAEVVGGRLLPNGSVRVTSGGPVTELPGYAEGGWWVQDAAATLPVRLLGPVAGLNAVDLCAAPGGKTMQLIAAGARVTAVDRSPARLRLLRDNLDRTGMDAELVAADATEWRPPEPVDVVLVDAPCSATGTIRRNPDIPWTKSANPNNALGDAQVRLIANAARMVKPGGRIVYCVCSLEEEEGPGVLRRFLSEVKGLRPCAVSDDPVLTTFLRSDVDGIAHLRTFPFHYEEWGGMDGFFAVAFERPV